MRARGLAAVLVAALGLSSCRLLPAPRPLPPEALEVAEQAHLAQRLGREAEAAALWARAAELAPDWVTPRRALQLAELRNLRGPLAYAAARAAAHATRSDPARAEAYLLARLEPLARDPFLAGARAGSAWAAHGLGVHRLAAGRADEAVVWARRAVERARGPIDRVLFLEGLARAEAASGEDGPERARRLLRTEYLALGEGSSLRADLFLAHLEVPGGPGATSASPERAWWEAEAASWLEDPRLSEAELRVVRREALGPRLAREVEAARRLGPSGPPPWPTLDLPRFAPGSQVPARPPSWSPRWSAWAADLPRVVLDEDLLPRDPAWREAVRLAERLGPYEAEIAAALLAVGAVDEALAVASSARSGLVHLEAGREGLERLARALEGLAMDELELWVGDATLSFEPPRSPQEALRALDQALAPVARLSPELAEVRLEDARLTNLGPLATLLVPVDAKGEPAGSAGRLLERLRTWLQITWPLGMRPQVVLGQALLVEACEGELLGRPWSGTRAVLRGVQGTTVGGAAHPGGYWVDADAAASAARRWRSLRARFREATALRAALDCPAPPGDAADLLPLLGEGDRVALATMAPEGWSDGAGELELEAPSVSDLLDLSLRHEEAHLADYRQWLPVWRALPSVLGLVLEGSFSVRGTWALVEARAQLTALCVAPEPRLALVEVLWLVEDLQRGLARGEYPHAEGYERLLRGLLGHLPQAAPGLDPSRALCHQLHRVGPEELRRAALALAREWGLVAPGWQPGD
jgi:tetratricopeptide (TPR) repeat protein